MSTDHCETNCTGFQPCSCNSWGKTVVRTCVVVGMGRTWDIPRKQQLHMDFLQFSWAIPKEERCHIPLKVDRYNTAKLCTKCIRLPNASQMQRGRIAQHTYIQMHIHTHTTLPLLFSLCSLCLLNNWSAWRLIEFSDLLPALRTPLLTFTQNSS